MLTNMNHMKLNVNKHERYEEVSWVHIMVCVNVNNMYPSNVLSNMYLLLVSNIKHS